METIIDTPSGSRIAAYIGWRYGKGKKHFTDIYLAQECSTNIEVITRILDLISQTITVRRVQRTRHVGYYLSHETGAPRESVQDRCLVSFWAAYFMAAEGWGTAENLAKRIGCDKHELAHLIKHSLSPVLPIWGKDRRGGTLSETAWCDISEG